MKHKADSKGKIRHLYSFLLALLLFSGCDFFSGNDQSSNIESRQQVIFQGTLNAASDLSFSSPEFSLLFDKTSSKNSQSVRVTSNSNFDDFPWNDEFLIISKNYSIELENTDSIFIPFAKIGFAAKNEFNPESLFAISYSEEWGWRAFSAAGEPEGGKLTFSTPTFSRWFLSARTNPAKHSPSRAPTLTASPALILSDTAGFPADDALISTEFFIASDSIINPVNFDFKITAIAESPFSFLLRGRQEQTREIIGQLGQHGLYEATIDLFHDSSVETAISQNHASASIRLNFSGQRTKNLPTKMVFASKIIGSGNLPYVNHAALSFSTEAKPTEPNEPQEPPPLIVPALINSSPYSGEKEVAIDRPLILEFNKAIDMVSFNESFTISPDPGLDKSIRSWNEERTQVTLEFPPFSGDTEYSISLLPGMKAQDQTELSQSIDVTFSTRESQAPALVESFPANEATLPLNGQLQFVFDENIAGTTFQIEILPAVETTISINGNLVTVAPADKWAEATSYQFRILPGLADLFGNQSAQEFRLNFSTDNVIAPAISDFSPANGSKMLPVNPMIQITFDQQMNKGLTEQAINLSVAEIAANFAWNQSGTVLNLSFQKSLDFATDYQIIIDKKAESATGIKLANQYFYRFSTINRPVVVQEQVSPAINETNVASDCIVIIPFDRQMNRESAQKSFSMLEASGKIITGNFNWTGDKMYFTPAAQLTAGQSYQVQIGQDAADISGYSIGQPFSYSFTVAYNPRITVLSTSPANGSSNVGLDSSIEIFFSGPVKPNNFGFTISPTINGSILQVWNQDNTKIVISFAEGFKSGTSYQFSLSEGIVDTFGQPIADFSPIAFSCETSNLPRIIYSLPTNGSTGILPDTTIELKFDQSMNQESVAAALAISPALANEPSLVWSEANRTLTITPTDWLEFGQNYQITLGSQAENEAGIQTGRQKQIAFSTRTQTIATVISPASAASDIDYSSPIIVEFSRGVNQESAQTNFQVIAEGQTRSGSFSWNGNQMSFLPDTPFAPENKVVFGFVNQVTDIDGYPVKIPDMQSFTTKSVNPPQILSTNPENASTNLARDIEIQIVFSEKMNTESVDTVFSPAVTSYNKVWSTDKKVLTINGLLLSGNTDYVLTIGESSSSDAGKLITGNRNLAFNTAAIPGPNVVQTEPIPDSENILTSAPIKIYFDRGIVPTSFVEALSVQPAIDYELTFAEDGKLVTINLRQRAQTATLYHVSISQALQSLDGQALEKNFSLYFTTEKEPGIFSISPANGAVAIATDSKIIVAFNKDMDKPSVENAFKLTSGFNIIPCSFAWETPQKAVCTPTELRPGKDHQVFIGTEAKDNNGNQLLESFTAIFATTPPPLFKVEFNQPEPGITNAPLDQSVVASFSNPVTLDSVKISYQPAPPSAYSLDLSADARALSIIPNGHLKGGQAYQVKILADTIDIFESKLGTDVSLSFTTVIPAAPEVVETTPVAGSFEIPLDQKIVVSFNQPMNRTSVENAFSIIPVLSQANFAWTADYKQFTLTYQGNLVDGTAYQAKIAAEAKDQFDTSLGIDYLLPFQTVFRPELLVSQLNPAPDSTRIPVQTVIKMVFSKTMNLASVESAFSMTRGGTSVPGNFAQNQQTIVFTPASALAYNQVYNLSLNSSAHDLQQNFIKAPRNWSFTTAPEQGKVWEPEVYKTTSDNVFSGRSDHAAIALGQYLYVIGGFDGTYLNDVWRSEDGKNWTPILEPTSSENTNQFAPRAGHACVVYNGEIWLTGGFAETDSGNRYFDDVWHSDNGVTWTKAIAEADYFQRAWHNLVVFNDRLWIIAGQTQDANQEEVLLDDCWESSADGKSWVQRSQVTAFFPRKKAAAASIGGKLWVWGGYGRNSQGQIQVLNDNWSTSNGDLWLLNSSGNMFSPRCGMAQTLFSDRYWIAGGSGSTEGTASLFNDVWATSDGLNWFQILENSSGTASQFSPTTNFTATAFIGKMMVLGGEKSDGLTNEVWSSE